MNGRIVIVIMKSLLIFILLFGIALPALSQQSNGNQQVSREAFQAEINKAIAAYPNGAELYRVSDGFEHLIYSQVAKKLGLTEISSLSSGNTKDNVQSLSN